uniref:Uncharacterized protein n=1 Tax=Opuntia streptacantha TaxID=393608 RepID=A0A7C9DNR2_OPUST
MTRVLGPQLGSNPNHRPHIKPAAQLNHQVNLFLQFKHNHSVERQLTSNNSKRDILSILETIAHKQGIWVALAKATHSKQELRLRPSLKPEPERVPDPDDILHNKAVLVAFDRVHALVVRPIPVRLDGVFKGSLERFKPVLEDVRKSDDEGEVKTQPARGFRIGHLLDDLQEVNLLVGQSGITKRLDRDVAGGIDGKVRWAPAVNSVESSRKGGRPMEVSGGGDGRRRYAGKGASRREKRRIGGDSEARRATAENNSGDSRSIDRTRHSRHPRSSPICFSSLIKKRLTKNGF